MFLGDASAVLWFMLSGMSWFPLISMFGKRGQRVTVEVETLEGLGIEEEVKLRKYFARVRSCCCVQFIMAKVLW